MYVLGRPTLLVYGVRSFVCLSHSLAARGCCGFGAIGPAIMQEISIDCCSALSSSCSTAGRAAADAGSAMLSADVGS